MTNLLITGATGNVGKAVVEALNKMKHHLEFFGGIRNIDEEDILQIPVLGGQDSGVM